MPAMFDHSPRDPASLPLPQSGPYAEAMRACGASVHYADLGCGWAQVVQRGRLRLVTRGPVWQPDVPPDDRRRALRRLARWPGLTVATPEQDLRGAGLIPLVTPLHVAIWDLSGDLRAGLDRKWRNHLSSAERAGVAPLRDDGRAILPLIAAEARQRRARRYVAHPQHFTNALPADALRVWSWWHEGELGAAMMFVRHGTTASYHLSWAGPEARARSVHAVMLWQAACALRDERVRWLDLGSVNDEQAPGLARFKLGTGAELRRLGHTVLVLPGS